MAAQAQRTTVEALLEREARQRPSAAREDGGTTDDSSAGVSGLNAVWRQKVVHWYFTLVSALQRQHDAAAVAPAAGSESTSSDPNPFDRAAVHVSASLLDGYIMSLPSERALRYKHDRPAYQLLATTCLLLGMRLAMHDRVKDARRDEGKAEQQQCGLKRAKAKMTNMNEAATTTPSAATAMPNAATILRISAAPKSMSEQQVLSMVREMTGSRAFPRSRVVTALDYIAALGGTRTELSQDGSSITLGPAEAEEASRIADILLQRDATFLSCAPSAVACAVITMALARSDASAHLDVSSLRQRVFRSIFGPEADQALVGAVLQAESKILVGAPASRNHARRVVPTTHLIPLEDE